MAPAWRRLQLRLGRERGRCTSRSSAATSTAAAVRRRGGGGRTAQAPPLPGLGSGAPPLPEAPPLPALPFPFSGLQLLEAPIVQDYARPDRSPSRLLLSPPLSQSSRGRAGPSPPPLPGSASPKPRRSESLGSPEALSFRSKAWSGSSHRRAPEDLTPLRIPSGKTPQPLIYTFFPIRTVKYLASLKAPLTWLCLVPKVKS